MSEAAPHTGREHATDRVLHDLVDMVLAENLLGAADWAIVSARAPGAALQRFPLDDGELWLALPLADDTQLAWRVRRALFPRPWRLSRPPVLAVRAGGVTAVPLEPAEVVRALRGRQRPGPVWPAVDLVATDLADVPAFTARADDAAPAVLDALVGPGAAPTLAEGEQVAALGDWPFHPLGRHKRGWDADDARRWGPHAPAAFGLAWWAVPRGWVRSGTGRAGDAGGP
ncbi:MAG TPA: IucA/IucC family protein, partial [Acidimicrobiales bacterium]